MVKCPNCGGKLDDVNGMRKVVVVLPDEDAQCTKDDEVKG